TPGGTAREAQHDAPENAPAPSRPSRRHHTVKGGRYLAMQVGSRCRHEPLPALAGDPVRAVLELLDGGGFQRFRQPFRGSSGEGHRGHLIGAVPSAAIKREAKRSLGLTPATDTVAKVDECARTQGLRPTRTASGHSTKRARCAS